MAKAFLCLALALPFARYGQPTLDGFHQVNYASNLDVADAVVTVRRLRLDQVRLIAGKE
jgi:hypothetical protein